MSLKKLDDEKDVKIYQLEKEVSEIQAVNTRLMTKIDDMSIKMETLNRDMASLQKKLDTRREIKSCQREEKHSEM